MRNFSATVSRSSLIAAAMRRHPAGGCCRACGGTGWVPAVADMPELVIECPCHHGQVA